MPSRPVPSACTHFRLPASGEIELQVLHHLPEGEQQSACGERGGGLVARSPPRRCRARETLPRRSAVLLGDVGRQREEDQQTGHGSSILEPVWRRMAGITPCFYRSTGTRHAHSRRCSNRGRIGRSFVSRDVTCATVRALTAVNGRRYAAARALVGSAFDGGTAKGRQIVTALALVNLIRMLAAGTRGRESTATMSRRVVRDARSKDRRDAVAAGHRRQRRPRRHLRR